jgi:hypothetical protein
MKIHARASLFLSLIPLSLSAALFSGCKSQPEQAVVNVAQNVKNNARDAEHKAQSQAAELDKNRNALARIPVPNKSLYVDVHEPGAWLNPFISVDATMITVRITHNDANPSSMGQGTILRPESARRQEIQIKPDALTEALIALPDDAWHYGRVVAVGESPLANPKSRPQIRRNIEASIKQLNDLGVVVEEWPTR